MGLSVDRPAGGARIAGISGRVARIAMPIAAVRASEAEWTAGMQVGVQTIPTIGATATPITAIRVTAGPTRVLGSEPSSMPLSRKGRSSCDRREPVRSRATF
jgi:hypothetical protein